jgi:3-oxoacyl-[acyl-carrier protein] reductase
MDDIFSLRGRVALITGASSGLGRRFGLIAAARGARVVALARRADRLAALVAEIKASGGEAMAVTADVADRAAMSAAFDQAESTFGTVDVFVANAGIAAMGTPSAVTESEWRDMMTTNLDAVFFGIQDASRRMIAARKAGSIVAIASTAGLRAAMGVPAYAVTKAGVVQVIRIFARELGPSGIRVNAIAPGWTSSDMADGFINSPQGIATMATLPLRRHGEQADLDGVFLLLASNAGSYITGVTVPVDGGLLLT